MDSATSITRHLFSLHARGIKYDLGRMTRAVARLGNPEHACPCFHVAGTNGKGSVCAFLESSLRRLGFKTGLYTSPHLSAFEERFQINGVPVSEAALVGVYEQILPVIEELHLTFFESSTLIAFELFRREKVEWAVYETGLGGRLDATNVLVPRVSIITPLALDHQEHLGIGIVAVAGEKLGIVKHRTPLVMARPDHDTVRELAVIHALRNEISAQFVDEGEAEGRKTGPDGSRFSWHGQEFKVNLRGKYQILNALLALNGLKSAGFYDMDIIAEGIDTARLSGRFQVTDRDGKCIVFDVGHNSHAVEAFCRALKARFGQQPITMVLGIMKDKDLTPMMKAYSDVAHRMVLTAPATERAARSEDLQAALPAGFTGRVELAPSVAAAVSTALQGDHDVVCAAGSFFTVGEAMRVLGIKAYG
jgi:dihydrofolate synthase/folylpolyglutamate synthase